MASLEHQKKLKELTIRKIFRECLNQKEFISTTIRNNLNYSKPTINDVLNHLENNNLIIEKGYTQGDIGRKARKFQINDTPWLSLAIEVDIKAVKFALVNLCGSISHIKVIENQVFTRDTFISILSELMHRYLEELPSILRSKVKSCAISIPGDISFDRKIIVYATNMSLKNIDISPLEQKFNIPIIFENEANCGALAEFYFSKNIAQTSLYISISDQGVGGGYIIDGQLQKGANRKGGEIGHFTIEIDGKECSCGNYGCFERYTSNQALLQLLEKNGFIYNSFKEALSDLNNEKIIQKYCYYLGRGIRSLATIFDPHQIVIGGEISKYQHRIEKYIHSEVFTNNNFNTTQILKIEYAKNKELTSLIGAGLLSFFPMIYEEEVYQ